VIHNRAILTALTRVALGAAFAVPVAVAAPPVKDWAPTLEPAARQGVRGPSDPIRLILPSLPVAVLQTLSLELDGLDVTGMVASDGKQATFTPPQPLAYGRHELRLLENAPDGSIIERAAWTIEVRKTRAFREADAQLAATVIGSYRVDDNHLENLPDEFQSSGGAQFQGVIADGNWRSTGYLDVLYNSQLAQTPTQQRRTDLGQFLVTGALGDERFNGVAQAGHHNVLPESLIAQGFLRRGVSAGLNAGGGIASASVFSQSTADIIGFQRGLGVSDAERRTDGVTASGRPIPGSPDALVLTGTWLNGEGPDQTGAVVGGDPTVTSGKAYSVVADSNLFTRRLRLRGEYAATDFDFDGRGRDIDSDGVVDFDAPEESADAYAVLIAYTPTHQLTVGNQPMVWNVGVENKRIGTFFRSPANPAGVADRDLVRLFGGVNWAGLDLQASVGSEKSNVDDLALIETVRGRRSYAVANYAPQPDYGVQSDGGPPPAPWYGQPAFALSYDQLDQEVIDASPTVAAGDFRSTQQVGFTAMFNYTTWNWMLAEIVGKEEDLTGVTPDRRTRTTQAQAGFLIANRLQLGPSVAVTNVEELNPQRDSQTLTAGLNASYAFTQSISAGLGYVLNREDASDDLTDRTTRDLTGYLSWAAIRPRGLLPGLTLSLEGLYHDETGDVIIVPGTTALPGNSYQIFVKAAVSWQAVY